MKEKKFQCGECGRKPFNTAADVRKHHLTDCAGTQDKDETLADDTVNIVFSIAIAIFALLITGAFKLIAPRG